MSLGRGTKITLVLGMSAIAGGIGILKMLEPPPPAESVRISGEVARHEDLPVYLARHRGEDPFRASAPVADPGIADPARAPAAAVDLDASDDPASGDDHSHDIELSVDERALVEHVRQEVLRMKNDPDFRPGSER